MTLKIVFPTKPHLVRYIMHRCNVPGPELALSAPGEIPLILRSLLAGKLHAAPLRHELAEQKYSGQITLVLPHWQSSHGAFTLTLESVHLANQFLSISFNEWVVDRVMQAHALGITENQILYQIIEELGIDELYTFDALKKASYRLREKKKLPALR